MLCPCCSNLPFDQCCQPIIDGAKAAPTPQALMRSRYSAYCLKTIDYIYDTYAQSARLNQTKADIAVWAQSVSFVRLEILACSDEPEYVEFCADYIEGGKLYKLHEKSRFIKEQGQWRYIDGEIFPHPAITLGRNDPCPCDSGKKFKKCHG